jgi:hypothetical protein
MEENLLDDPDVCEAVIPAGKGRFTLLDAPREIFHLEPAISFQNMEVKEPFHGPAG